MARLSGAGPEGSQEPGQDESAQVVKAQTRQSDNVPPFFNTTFSTHRVSPLWIGAQKLDATRLELLARHLRELLVGDVVRGVQIGLEETQTLYGKVGPLRAVQIRWFQASDVLGDEIPEELTQRSEGRSKANSSSENGYGPGSGLWIHLRHENGAYHALLMPCTPDYQTRENGKSEGTDSKVFVQLPLLLLRMPQALKGVIADWIAASFDCRVSKVNFGTRTLISIWEAWIRVLPIEKGPDFNITLAFHLPPDSSNVNERAVTDSKTNEADQNAGLKAGLRNIDITIKPRDLRKFVRAGENLRPAEGTGRPSWENDPRERRRLAGGNADDGWAWRTDANQKEDPFTEALARYLDHHLALNLFHPGVRVVQITCGGFVLAQSRLKIARIGGEVSTELSQAAWMFVMQLGERVAASQTPAVFPIAT